MAGSLDLTIDQGATFDRTLTWWTDSTRTTAVNLTGYTAAMQVRKNHYDAAALLSLVSGAGITLGGVLGTIRVVMTAAQTRDLVGTPLVYDLELTSGGGVVTRLVEGSITLKPEVTR